MPSSKEFPMLAKMTPLPTARRILDISMALENDVASDPPGLRPHIRYIDHQMSFDDLAQFFPGLQREHLPGGESWAVEEVQLNTHNGTHLDAPYHFASTMDKGQKALSIDEVDLNWCFQPAIKLDFRHFSDGYIVQPADVEAALQHMNHQLSPLEIVLVNTRAGDAYGTPDYLRAGCGMGYEATMYLLERGVRLTGTDAWSWDAPFAYTAQRYTQTGDASLIWEGHKAGLDIGYCHLEKLHNLQALPDKGFYVSCFPVKVKGASAGWTRAVAIFDPLLTTA